MKIKVNPLFFAFILALIAFGHALDFAWLLLALIIHELSHTLMARARGYVLKSVTLLPYGAMLSTSEGFDGVSGLLIGLAGPVSNLVLALVTLGVWWLFPSTYAFSLPFLYACLSLGLFNLLPVFPLDGSRVVLAFCKNRLRAIKGMQAAGVAVALLLLVLFLASFFFGLNISLGIMAVFLFYGAVFVAREETYISVLDASSKNYSLGVEQKRVAISVHTPIVRLFHHISSSSHTTFDVLDDSEQIIATLSEQQIKGLCVNGRLSRELAELIKDL